MSCIEELRKHPAFYDSSKKDGLKLLIQHIHDNVPVYGYFATEEKDADDMLDFIKGSDAGDCNIRFGTLAAVDTMSPCFRAHEYEGWHELFVATSKDGSDLITLPHFKGTVINNFAEDSTGGKSMSKASETMQSVISMKMLNGLMKNGEQDLGKLMIMQQMMGGEKIQVTDVLKARLISEFSLDKSGELPLEKVMLMQMLEGGELDVSQILAMKMLGSVIDETDTKAEEKNQ